MMVQDRHKYEYEVNLDADNGPARVVRMVGEGKCVLEIGAGAGSITRILSAVSKCRVTALDIDADAIKLLESHCERTCQANLNDSAWPEVLGRDSKFDVLVAADVLEHVYEPLNVLIAMKVLLDENGFAVISLPHAGHSVIQACLFDEDFEYGEVGLLDRTHIRFFGIKNIQKLFEDAGLKIVQAEFVVRNPEFTEFSKRWARMPHELRDVLAMNPFGLVYQVIVKAVPVEADGTSISLIEMVVTPQNPTFKESMLAYLRLHLSGKMYAKLLKLNEMRHKYLLRNKP